MSSELTAGAARGASRSVLGASGSIPGAPQEGAHVPPCLKEFHERANIEIQFTFMQRKIKHISENDKRNNDFGVPIRLLGRNELKMHHQGAFWSVRGAPGVGVPI